MLSFTLLLLSKFWLLGFISLRNVFLLCWSLLFILLRSLLFSLLLFFCVFYISSLLSLIILVFFLVFLLWFFLINLWCFTGLLFFLLSFCCFYCLLLCRLLLVLLFAFNLLFFMCLCIKDFAEIILEIFESNLQRLLRQFGILSKIVQSLHHLKSEIVVDYLAFEVDNLVYASLSDKLHILIEICFNDPCFIDYPARHLLTILRFFKNLSNLKGQRQISPCGRGKISDLHLFSSAHTWIFIFIITLKLH